MNWITRERPKIDRIVCSCVFFPIPLAILTPCAIVAVAAASHHETTQWDFEDATVGQLPPEWTEAKTGSGMGSIWKIIQDKTAPNGHNVLAQTAESPGSLFNICVANDTRFKDVELAVSFKSVKGRTDQGGGLVWRYVDSDNYYITRFNPLEDNFRLYKVVAGKRIQLATKEGLKAPADKWHTLAVRMKGNQIECDLNGRKELEAKDDTFDKAGQVGLWTKADAQTYFDGLQVSETKGPVDPQSRFQQREF